MNRKKIITSVLCSVLAVSLFGTSIPASDTLSVVHLDREDLNVASDTTEGNEVVITGNSGSPIADHETETRNIWNMMSSREKSISCEEPAKASKASGKKASVTPKAKDTGDEDPGNVKDPAGGNTMGSSFKKESVSGKSLETAYVRDKYMSAHKGIDISQFNGDIDWKKVVDSGIEAVIIRVGGRYGSSEGGIYPDKRRDENLKNAIAAGLSVGVYFYSQAVTVDEGIEEAKFCLDAVKGYDIDLPIIIDYEWEPGYRLANGGTSEQRTEVVKAFCKTCTSAGYRAGIYASDYCFKDYLIPDQIYGKYYIWIAHWTQAELPGIAYFGPFDGWQYSSTGSVPGIYGNVDMDYFYWVDRFFVNYYIEDDLKYDSTKITLGIKARTKTAEELGIATNGSKLFAGWHVFREKDDCWAAYKLSDENKKTVWVEPGQNGELPEGYGYKIYPDGVAISSTAKGGNVNFYATWTEEGFVVRYHNGKINADTVTPVYYGQKTATSGYESLGFFKNDHEFAGWKVSRSCDGLWAAYKDDDESRKTVWVSRKNGELPEGYSYKYFPDKVKIGTTAPTGFLDFYAHWEKKAS